MKLMVFFINISKKKSVKKLSELNFMALDTFTMRANTKSPSESQDVWS